MNETNNNNNELENLKNKKMNESTGAEVHSVKIFDGELFTYQLSTGCTKEMQNKTRSCLQSLMISWRNIREKRPLLKNVRTLNEIIIIIIIYSIIIYIINIVLL